MYCMLCQKKIDESKGYFTILIRGNRYDYHIPCRPNNLPQEIKMGLKFLCHECSGVLRTGMAIRKRPEGNYHIACWFRKQEQEKEDEKKTTESSNTKLPTKGRQNVRERTNA